MTDRDDEALFRVALEAMEREHDVPARFAEEVVARARDEASPARARWLGWAASALALLGLSAPWMFVHRRIEQMFESHDSITEIALGERGVVVLAPGSAGRFAVGGLGEERVQLDHGSAFFRIETGGPLVVETEDGLVRVHGTCFEVTRLEDEMSASNAMRGRWFGAGALAAGMLVVVYEGAVDVASSRADGSEPLSLAAGEGAFADMGGVHPLRSMSAEGPESSEARGTVPAATPAAPTTDGPMATGASAEALAENARLRSLLERNAISPETGERLPNARRGVEDAGNTDLTPEEWDLLAERGELRFRLPDVGRTGLDRAVRASAALTDDEAAALSETIRSAHTALDARVGAVYADATGHGAEGRSLSVMMSEIEDLTAADEAAHVRWMLAQERAGRPTTPSERMSEYERMMRELVRFESDLERDAAANVGAERAHRVLTENSAHAYGMSGHPRPGTTAPSENAP